MSADAVIVTCGKCAGKRQWMALEPKRFVGKQLRKAALRGDTIRPEAEALWKLPNCLCPTEEAS